MNNEPMPLTSHELTILELNKLLILERQRRESAENVLRELGHKHCGPVGEMPWPIRAHFYCYTDAYAGVIRSKVA